MSARVAGVYLGLDPHSPVTTRADEARVTWEGFAGDRHAGLTRPSDGRTPHYPRGTEIRNSRQVSIVSAEELAEIAAAMGLESILPEWLGANLLLTGVPRLTRLPAGVRLFFSGGAVLVSEGENLPCIAPGRVIHAHHPHIPGLAPLFVRAAWGRRGIVAWVEKPGLIRVGDDVRLLQPPGGEHDSWHPILRDST
ncbi:MAG: MOSC domain-containing protein [Anaerolineae bacterium]|nr:MOSC domain-containing protein [Anaerolineae bacterium]